MKMPRVKDQEAVPLEKFLESVSKHAAAGRSVEDCAKELNLKPASVSVRLSQLRKKFKDAGIEMDLPRFKGGTRKSTLIEDAKAILERIKKNSK
jgi:hypothetical protein